ncbi:hypothetical protein D918_02894 [Trichuris suis]|nr:hypothetical protein D918_02894 [Trichuris suis]
MSFAERKYTTYPMAKLQSTKLKNNFQTRHAFSSRLARRQLHSRRLLTFAKYCQRMTNDLGKKYRMANRVHEYFNHACAFKTEMKFSKETFNKGTTWQKHIRNISA